MLKSCPKRKFVKNFNQIKTIDSIKCLYCVLCPKLWFKSNKLNGFPLNGMNVNKDKTKHKFNSRYIVDCIDSQFVSYFQIIQTSDKAMKH